MTRIEFGVDDIKEALEKTIGMRESVFKERSDNWTKANKDVPNMLVEPAIMSIGVNIITSHFWLLLTYFLSPNETYDDGKDFDKLTDDTNDVRSVTILNDLVRIF